MNSVLGKYIPANSILHRMDPRVKVFLDILMIVVVFLIRNFIVFGIIALPIILLFLQAKNRPMKLVSMLKPVIFLGIFLLIINFFIQPTGTNITTYYEWRWFKVTYEGIEISLRIMARVYLMIIITTLLTSTTKPLDLTRGIEDLMSPFKLVKFPSHIIAMIISIALRFIPTLLDESTRIMKAQASRGVDFHHGGFRTKVKTTIVLIIPLFVSSFAKAEDLANAMETRGYDPYAQRTRYRQYKLRWSDFLSLLIVIALFTNLVLMNAGVYNLPFWWV